MKEFTEKELAEFNGENGKPIYIAHEGRVYDVTASKMWQGGLHMRRHQAGQDLTTDIQAAPHDPDVLERYPQVGILKKEEAPDVDMPAFLAILIKRFPMLRRHPHPMTVHFPIVFCIFTPIFNSLYLITGINAFETTAMHCLAASILFTLVAYSTGVYTWWLNYLSQPMRAVKIKTRVGVALIIVEIIAFIWRMAVPDVMLNLQGINVLYYVMTLSLLPLVTINGWFGASLTFPPEKD